MINKSQTLFRLVRGGFEAPGVVDCIYDFISAKSRLSKNKSNTRFELSCIHDVFISFMSAIFSKIFVLISALILLVSMILKFCRSSWEPDIFSGSCLFFISLK
jgi:hypothetical protein